MTQSMRYAGFVAAAVGAMLAMPAAANTWQWDFPTSGCHNVNSCNITSTAGGLPSQTLKVHAFSTNHLETTDPQSATPSGNWIKANLYNFSGNFGIGNTVAGDTNECSSGSCSPEHAVDNAQVYDIMIFELPTGMQWDIEAFRLGWARENNAGTSADIQTWIGGTNSAIDFTNVCFNGGCSNSLLNKTGTMSTFKDVTSTMFNMDGSPAVGAPSDNNVPQLENIGFNGVQNGRYLIMTGALGHKMDAFKPEFIKATGKTVPLPGTLALLGLGFAGLVTFRPRGARAA